MKCTINSITRPHRYRFCAELKEVHPMSELSEQQFLIDPAIKTRLLVLVRACARERASAEAHKIALANQAALIPSFNVFRQLCMEDLTEAFHEDRHISARAQRNRRLVWLNLFKPFARVH